MRIAALEAFGIDDRIIDLWRESGHQELLPIQEKAVRECGVLNGKNVLVVSPTSSGKTFVGEMAAVKTARQNRRVIYLVPQKALAEEKYSQFHARYSSFGIHVVISTRDRKEFDRDIARGHFHIAVVVFEKMQSLLVTDSTLLRNVGLVVVDELQMIGDKERGANLEILLTKLKISEGAPQMIGLSAVLKNSGDLAKWLGASLCEINRRPVELRKGVLWNGEFHYIAHNSGEKGMEKLVPQNPDTATQGILLSQVKAFAESGESCIVFCKSKRESIQTAASVASALGTQPAKGALTELAELEDSRGKDVLVRFLEHGVAYHNADLDWDQRDIIERWFRKGEIVVLCATTTLAMGINLPAKNVFIDPDRWDRDRSGRWGTIPITQAEYENTGGRAGRLGLEKDFGRSIIVTDSQFQARTYYSTFVKGSLGDVAPALDGTLLSQHVLNLVASGLCRTAGEVRDVLLSSFTGTMCWRGEEREETFKKQLADGIWHCTEGGLIDQHDGELSVTELGRMAAVKGISVDTAIVLSEFAEKNKPHALDIQLIELLLCLAGTEEGESVHFNLSTPEYQSGVYRKRLVELVATLPESARQRIEESENLSYFSYEETMRAKKALLLHDWAHAVPTREVESRFQCFAGGIAGIAQELGWLAEALGAVAKIYGWPEDATKRLSSLSDQLVHGVPENAVLIVAASVRGLGRGRVNVLLQNGFDTLEKLAAASRQQIEKLVTKPVAVRLLRRVSAILSHKVEAAREAADGIEHAPEWQPKVPPSDDDGSPYGSAVQIVFDGRRKWRRHLLLVDGKDVWVAPQPFEAALKLAVATKTTRLGWVAGSAIGEMDSYHKIIHRLKRSFSDAGYDGEALLQNNQSKQYRFSVPAENIAIDVQGIRDHLPELADLLNKVRKSSAA